MPKPALHLVHSPVELVLPCPPSINDYYTIVPRPRPRIVISENGKRYWRLVGTALEDAGSPSFGNAKVAVSVNVYPGPQGLDGDNGLKALFDALQNNGVFTKDRQIKEHHVWSNDYDGTPRAEVLIVEKR